MMRRLIDTPRDRHPLTLERMTSLEDQVLAVAAGFDRLGHQDLARQADRVAADLRSLWDQVMATERAEREGA